MRVLITGSAGFVGRHLAQACLKRGDDVTSIDIANGNDAMSYFLASRIRQYEATFDLVLHCAAFVQGRAGIDGRPAHLIAYNAMLDSAMFTWALPYRPRRVVYFSSSAAYPAWMQSGADPVRPLHEDDIDLDQIWAPEASYGREKLFGEQQAAATRAEGVPVTVLRPFSGYGPDQSPDYPFRAFLDRARRREDPFDVWGSGDQVRDWIHIDDIVTATLTAAEREIDGPVNLCTGLGTTMSELAQMVCEISGYKPFYAYHDDRPAGVDYRVGDARRLHEFFRPQVTLEEGIGRALMA